jgi:chromosome segregation ATPase
MRARFAIIALGVAALLFSSVQTGTTQQKKDYLSAPEADKIRDAVTTSARMKLFVTFAEDRLNKLMYTLAHPNTDQHRAEDLNGLLNAYTGCIDDAADLIDVARAKQQDIRAGLKILKSKGKEYLTYLQDLAKKGPELESYKETLDDSIEATEDALSDAQKAENEISAPIRRKQ